MDYKDCKVNKRVALLSKTQPCNKGTVKNEAEPYRAHDYVVIVEWDGGSLEKVKLRSLITEAEGIAQDARIREEQERIEAKWARAESLVAEKLKSAADLINEASSLASESGKDLRDMYEATSVLMDALDNAGWSSSSMGC